MSLHLDIEWKCLMGSQIEGKMEGGAADTPADLLRITLASLISGTSVNSNREKVGSGDTSGGRYRP